MMRISLQPYDFTKAYDVGLQTDIATLDISKAFDTVPAKLLSKMGDYGILGFSFIHMFYFY
jgi:hypothetical protein